MLYIALGESCFQKHIMCSNGDCYVCKSVFVSPDPLLLWVELGQNYPSNT